MGFVGVTESYIWCEFNEVNLVNCLQKWCFGRMKIDLCYTTIQTLSLEKGVLPQNKPQILIL